MDLVHPEASEKGKWQTQKAHLTDPAEGINKLVGFNWPCLFRIKKEIMISCGGIQKADVRAVRPYLARFPGVE